VATINRYVGKVFHANALDLLRTMPVESVDAVIADPMYGVKALLYDWGTDPGDRDPRRHWAYHEPIYQECRRVLKPGGILAWAQGGKFFRHFGDWFGEHRVWTLTRFGENAHTAVGNMWTVQTRDQKPIEFPHRDSLVICTKPTELKRHHPCPKPVEEMAFMVEALTTPGQVVLDCFCGLGSTLVAAQQLGRLWIGCDLSRRYGRIALSRLAALQQAAAQERQGSRTGRCGTCGNHAHIKPTFLL